MALSVNLRSCGYLNESTGYQCLKYFDKDRHAPVVVDEQCSLSPASLCTKCPCTEIVFFFHSRSLMNNLLCNLRFLPFSLCDNFLLAMLRKMRNTVTVEFSRFWCSSGEIMERRHRKCTAGISFANARSYPRTSSWHAVDDYCQFNEAHTAPPAFGLAQNCRETRLIFAVDLKRTTLRLTCSLGSYIFQDFSVYPRENSFLQ